MGRVVRIESGLAPDPIVLACLSLLEEEVAGLEIARKNITLLQPSQSFVDSCCELTECLSTHGSLLPLMDPNQRLQTEMINWRDEIETVVSEIVGLGFEVV